MTCENIRLCRVYESLQYDELGFNIPLFYRSPYFVIFEKNYLSFVLLTITTYNSYKVTL